MTCMNYCETLLTAGTALPGLSSRSAALVESFFMSFVNGLCSFPIPLLLNAEIAQEDMGDSSGVSGNNSRCCSVIISTDSLLNEIIR